MRINKNIQYLIAICIIMGISARLFADIAPTQYKGWTLSPKFESQVQLVSETVDIYWSKVCKVKTVFYLNNHSDTAVHMKIGFPDNLTFLKEKSIHDMIFKSRKEISKDSINKIYDFAFTLNGSQLLETDIPNRDINRNEEQWYGWDCTIQPGQNTVHLSYNVRPNPTYAYAWQDNLYYVLHTGKFWDAKIDNAVVTVHFPHKISRDQIDKKTTPLEFNITDSSIVWEFRDFEPTDDHNIHLQIIGFDIFQQLIKYKTLLSNSQIDTKTKLDAAIFFASLTFAKGINFTAPAGIDSAYYYTTILPNLSPDELKIFQQTYGKTKYSAVGLLKTGHLYNEFSSNEELQHVLKSALLRTGYYENVEYKECWQFVELSNRLFREVVTEEPENENAWLAFLENAYRIHPEGCNPCKFGFSLRTGGYFQNKIAMEAYKYCPDNPSIKAWYKFAVPHSAELPDTIGKVRGQSKEGIEVLIRDQCFGGGIIQNISTDDLNVLEKKYQIAENQYIIKTTKEINEETRNAIIEILYKNTFYHLRLCHELKALK